MHRRDLRVRFRRPATLDDRLTVRSEVTEMRAASIRWHQRRLHGHGG